MDSPWVFLYVGPISQSPGQRYAIIITNFLRLKLRLGVMMPNFRTYNPDCIVYVLLGIWNQMQHAATLTFFTRSNFHIFCQFQWNVGKISVMRSEVPCSSSKLWYPIRFQCKTTKAWAAYLMSQTLLMTAASGRFWPWNLKSLWTMHRIKKWEQNFVILTTVMVYYCSLIWKTELPVSIYTK